eukprot:Nk52_evm10s252 gene=Nk52_evmTU10s252
MLNLSVLFSASRFPAFGRMVTVLPFFIVLLVCASVNSVNGVPIQGIVPGQGLIHVQADQSISNTQEMFERLQPNHQKGKKEYDLITFDLFAALVKLVPSLEENGHKYLPKEDIFMHNAKAIADKWVTMYSSLKDMNAFHHANGKEFWPHDAEPFKIMLRVTLRSALNELKIRPLSLQEEDIAIRVFGDLNPWPEATEALLKLKDCGYKLGILSNGDSNGKNGTLDMAARAFKGVEFDYIMGSSTVKVFKPEKAMYDQIPVATQGIKKEKILHIAGADFDAVGAMVNGIDAGWHNHDNRLSLINITGKEKYNPKFTVSKLTDILDHQHVQCKSKRS